MKMDHEVMDEDTLVSLVYLVPPGMLRRWVARALWFDLAEHVDGGLEQLKTIAAPCELDTECDFTLDEYRCALTVVGYTVDQVECRCRIHAQHVERSTNGTCVPESDRFLKYAGGKTRCNQWSE
jgi:hypothetical protein